MIRIWASDLSFLFRVCPIRNMVNNYYCHFWFSDFPSDIKTFPHRLLEFFVFIVEQCLLILRRRWPPLPSPPINCLTHILQVIRYIISSFLVVLVLVVLNFFFVLIPCNLVLVSQRRDWLSRKVLQFLC